MYNSISNVDKFEIITMILFNRKIDYYNNFVG